MKTLIYISILVLGCQISYSQKNGPFEKYHDNGQLKTVGQYENKKRVGEWKDYYDSGELYKTYSYSGGKMDTNRKSFYKSGSLKSERKKKGDKKLYNEYFESGVLFVEKIITTGYYKEYYESGSLKVHSNYVDNQLNGLWSRYIENGKKEWEVDYVNGYKDGAFKKYDEEGNLKVEGFHKEGKKNGKEKRYNTNRSLEWEGFYTNGRLDKKWKHYDLSGKVVDVLKYKNGVLLSKNQTVSLDTIEVPVGPIEFVPVYPGCEDILGNNNRKKCMSKKVALHVSEKFNTDLALTLGLSGRQKINVIFKIDKTGAVTAIRSRAAHPELENEAVRVIKSLPKMKPGIQRGKPVIVPFSLPIVFQINGKSKSKS